MRSRRPVAAAAAALAVAALLAGCGGEDTDHIQAQDGPVEGGNGITPTKMTASKGNKVEIKVTNTATDTELGFCIAEFGVKETIGQGKTTTVEFKADKSGTFKVYCQIHPTHKTAELVVS